MFPLIGCVLCTIARASPLFDAYMSCHCRSLDLDCNWLWETTVHFEQSLKSPLPRKYLYCRIPFFSKPWVWISWYKDSIHRRLSLTRWKIHLFKAQCNGNYGICGEVYWYPKNLGIIPDWNHILAHSDHIPIIKLCIFETPETFASGTPPVILN